MYIGKNAINWRVKYNKMRSHLNFSCKLNNIPFKEKDLLSVARINKIDFKAFKLKIVLQKILGFVENFGKGMPFYHMCKKIVYKFWPIIKDT